MPKLAVPVEFLSYSGSTITQKSLINKKKPFNLKSDWSRRRYLRKQCAVDETWQLCDVIKEGLKCRDSSPEKGNRYSDSLGLTERESLEWPINAGWLKKKKRDFSGKSTITDCSFQSGMLSVQVAAYVIIQNCEASKPHAGPSPLLGSWCNWQKSLSRGT